MPTSSLLDDATIDRAAPPGSMRYFALLYTPQQKREAVTALYVIDAEIRGSAQSVNHDVAHTRLQWWRQEIDRLVNANPQHPATRILLAQRDFDRRQFSRLHELLAAADMDLARMTYQNARELRAYSTRSGGIVQELIAALLASPSALDDPARAAANRIGVGVRQAEMLRDVRQDACEGRLYLPLDELEKAAVTLEDLRAREVSASVRAALAAFGDGVAADLDARDMSYDVSQGNSFAKTGRAYLRPLFVMAALHRRLVDRIARSGYEVASQRIELGPVEKPWVAWRAARRTG